MTDSKLPAHSRRTAALPLWVISLFASIVTCIFIDFGLRAYYYNTNLPRMRTKAPAGQKYEVNIANATFTQPIGFKTVTYRTNEFGFRGGSLDFSSPSILMLGDSFLFGLYLDECDTVPFLLEQQLRIKTGKAKLQVANGAVLASGLAEWVAFFEDYGAELRPTTVILAMNTVSISRAYGHKLYQPGDDGSLLRFDPASKNYLSSSPTQVGKLFQPYQPKKNAAWSRLTKSALLTLVRRAFRRQTVDVRAESTLPYEDPQATDESLRAYLTPLLTRAKSAADRIGARLVVANLGFDAQSEELKKPGSIDAIGLRLMPGILAQLNIDYVDLKPAIEAGLAAKKEMRLARDGHPTAEANHRLAEALSNFIIERRVFN